ncbi:MAG: hypothetical protein MI919_37510 [Holophagales bacterium]|nr:hypothetical protein [Holophagales bacterium]
MKKGATMASETINFRRVKKVAFEAPYASLPTHKIKFRLLLAGSRRTVSDDRDILPHFDKAVHPNGICFSGLWTIDTETPFSGYFKAGSKGLLIARVSVPMSKTTQGHRRGFGFAGKIFPTLDPSQHVKPANFFVLDDFSGTYARHFADVEMTSSPSIGYSPLVWLTGFVFRLADREPSTRQLYPISMLGLRPGENPVTPQGLMLRTSPGTIPVDQPDFRDELRLENYSDNRLTLDIHTRSVASDSFTRIGRIDLDDYAVCEGCDHRLHFPHPRFKD